MTVHGISFDQLKDKLKDPTPYNQDFWEQIAGHERTRTGAVGMFQSRIDKIRPLKAKKKKVKTLKKNINEDIIEEEDEEEEREESEIDEIM